MAIERDADDVVRCFLLAREVFELGHDTVFDGEVVGLAPVGAFVAFGEGYEGLLPVRRLRGDWWELDDSARCSTGPRRAARSGSATRSASRSDASTHRAAGSTSTR